MEESNAGGAEPLKQPGYVMHITDLAPGNYRFVALAGQRPYADMMETARAKFVRTDIATGDDIAGLGVQPGPPRGGRRHV